MKDLIDMLPTLLHPCDRANWPTAYDPITKRQFTPAFLYRAAGGWLWTISTEADAFGRIAGQHDFNPAAAPAWVCVTDNKAAD